MKSSPSFSRYSVLLVVILCYLIPVLGMTVYGTILLEDKGLWELLSLGFFLTCFGALMIFWMLAKWESKGDLDAIPPKGISEVSRGEAVSFEEHDLIRRSLEEAQQAQVRLLSEIDLLTGEIRTLASDKDRMALEMQNEGSSLEQYKKSLHHDLELQQNLIRELYGTIADQKNQMEKKQQQMTQLESKVGDLTYEIKTLLQFAETHAGSLLSAEEAAPPVRGTPPLHPQHEIGHEEAVPLHIETKIQSGQEASQLLKRCLDTAQRITGSQRFGSQIYSFLDSPADSFALDLRRLCDKLRSEAGGIILLYSPRENHLLFANNEVKALTGWSPEKFSQHFFEILADEAPWKQGVGSLAMRSEAHIQMQLKARSGQTIEVNASLGMIPTGIFRNHTVAVLYACSSAGSLQNQLKQ